MILPSGFKRLALSFATVLFIVFTLPAHAQTSGTGTISGTVTDTSGAAVPDAHRRHHQHRHRRPAALSTRNGAGEYAATFPPARTL